MAFDAHVNGGYSTVASAPSPATSGTSLTVASGEGSRFPAVPFNATVWGAGTIWLPTGVAATTGEVVRVTARSGDVLTIVRGQESSTARTIVVGDQIAAAGTAKNITDIEGKFPVAVADGGTGQTTTNAAKGVSGLAIEGIVLPGDADLAGVATDWFVGFQTTLTTVRTYTLPAASAVGIGHEITVADLGACNGYSVISVARHGSDTINGGTTAVTILALSRTKFMTDASTTNWVVVDTVPAYTNATSLGASFDGLGPTAAQGDIIYRNATTNTRLTAGTSGQGLVTGGASANPAWASMVVVNAFTASGTWTKPANATWVKVICVGSGGGGGGGRLGPIGVVRAGGGGGAAGNWVVAEFQAADLASTETVTIPAGGAAGAGKGPLAVATTGGAGGSPAATTFGTSVKVTASGGGGGSGGTNTTGPGGTATTDFILSSPWVTASNPPSGAAGGVGGGAQPGTAGTNGAPGSGAGGGGITTGNASDLGGAGGGGGGVDKTNAAILTGGTAGGSTGASGGAGQNSGTSPSSSLAGGSGGGSGAAGTGATATTTGGAGNNGGTWGAGGGGGGAGTFTTGPTVNGTSGAGGTGGKGYVIVISYR